MPRQLHRLPFLVWIILVSALTSATRSVWEGVYTKEQAKRGQATYERECTRCHGQDLAGGEGSASLAGADFLNRWNGKTAGALYETLKQTMPSDDPGNLSTREYADVVAYIFSVNNFPAGEKELERDTAALNEIRIEAKR